MYFSLLEETARLDLQNICAHLNCQWQCKRVPLVTLNVNILLMCSGISIHFCSNSLVTTNAEHVYMCCLPFVCNLVKWLESVVIYLKISYSNLIVKHLSYRYLFCIRYKFFKYNLPIIFILQKILIQEKWLILMKSKLSIFVSGSFIDVTYKKIFLE